MVFCWMLLGEGVGNSVRMGARTRWYLCEVAQESSERLWRATGNLRAATQEAPVRLVRRTL